MADPDEDDEPEIGVNEPEDSDQPEKAEANKANNELDTEIHPTPEGREEPDMFSFMPARTRYGWKV